MGFRNTVRGVRPGEIRSEEIEQELSGKVVTGGLFRTQAPDLARVEIGKAPDDPTTGITDEIRFYGADGELLATGTISATAFNQMLYYADEHKFSSRAGTEETYPTGRIWAAEGIRIDEQIEAPGAIADIGELNVRDTSWLPTAMIGACEIVNSIRVGDPMLATAPPIQAINLARTTDGTVSGGAGRASYEHGLGVMPTLVLPVLRSHLNARTVNWFTADATHFECTFRDGAGVPIPDGTVVSIGWLAMALA